jgi:hypothetical protein
LGDAQRALDLIFSGCDRQPSCSQAFPEVREEFMQLLVSLETDPLEVSLPHPTSGEETHITFTSEKMATAVRLFSYTPETAALLPLMIHDASAQQEYQKLAATYLIIAGDFEASITEGMGYSVLCAEDLPFFSLDEAAKENAGSYLGDETAVQLSNVCQHWPHSQVSPEFKTPVQSNVPVLLLSGEAGQSRHPKWKFGFPDAAQQPASGGARPGSQCNISRLHTSNCRGFYRRRQCPGIRHRLCPGYPTPTFFRELLRSYS